MTYTDRFNKMMEIIPVQQEAVRLKRAAKAIKFLEDTALHLDDVKIAFNGSPTSPPNGYSSLETVYIGQSKDKICWWLVEKCRTDKILEACESILAEVPEFKTYETVESFPISFTRIEALAKLIDNDLNLKLKG